MEKSERTFESTRPWLFWLREYLHRASEHHGCNPIFQDVGRPSSEETLRTLESKKVPVFDYAYLGTFYPHMMFRAIKGYIFHKNWDDAPQNMVLRPVYEQFGVDGGMPGGHEPLVIDYGAGIERAKKELEALFLFEEGRRDDAIANLFVIDLKKNPRDIIFDVPRAVGLWLFDKTVNIERFSPLMPVGVADAVEELRDRYDMKKLWLENKLLPDFHFYLNKTIECITAEQVLPFTRRKPKDKTDLL